MYGTKQTNIKVYKSCIYSICIGRRGYLITMRISFNHSSNLCGAFEPIDVTIHVDEKIETLVEESITAVLSVCVLVNVF